MNLILFIDRENLSKNREKKSRQPQTSEVKN